MKKYLLLSLVIPVLCSAQYFDDIAEVHPNATAIQWMAKEGLIKGYTEEGVKVFHPENSVTRAAALKMLIGAAGMPQLPATEDSFPDVHKHQWFAPYVQTALEAGIVTGYADGKFYPASQVTRAEFLAMALRSFNSPIIEEEEGDWTEPFFELATNYRLLDGNAPTHQSLTRGEVAEILFRLVQVANNDYQHKFHYSGEGTVGWNGIEYSGKKMTNGQEFDPQGMTVAHRSLPLGTKLRVWNSRGNQIVVTVTDRFIKSEEQIITLSQKAFNLLSTQINTPTLILQFEVYSEPTDSLSNVPEYIRPELSDQLHNQPPVSNSILDTLYSQNITTDIVPMWDEVVPMLGKNFYQKIELREPFPQKIPADTVMNLSGRTDALGYKKITVFLQQLTTDEGNPIGDQIYFLDDISGRNFVVPVHFPNAGFFKMGVVLDDEKKSRVETIEVIRLDRERVMRNSPKDFDTTFEIKLIPERKELLLDLPDLDPTDLIKVELTQGNIRDKLVFEGGIKDFIMPYTWFDKFKPNQNLAFDIYASVSKDGGLAKRNSGWKKITYQNYETIPGFRDIESEAISIHDFPRWKRETTPFKITGTVLSPGVTLNDHAYITSPEGKVREAELTRIQDDFSFTVTPEGFGAHTIEVIEESGEILFNRQIFFSENWVLPVLEPHTTELPSESVPGVRAWINRVRAESGLDPVAASTELNNFAQSYADRMALEDFISHTSSTGQIFSTRVQAANISGTEFAENLGFGTTLQLALDELRASGSHLKNIVNRRWTSVGIGLTKTNKGWYLSQVFSR